MNVIEIDKLTKDFNGLRAVDGISFSVKEGEIFGLLGPNGAGKTTTINMLATMLMPTSGTAKVCGIDVRQDQDSVRRYIGIVFQDPALDDQLTGEENLDFHARMYGMESKIRKKRIDNVLEIVELKDRAKDIVSKYSGGMRRRLEIARGLMHYPKVLFLDEPTLGLDAQTRRVIWNYILKLNKRENITIILTTHYMEEADYLCNRVAIIDHGKILAIGMPSKLKKLVGEDMISLSTYDNMKLKKVMAKMKWIRNMKLHDNFLDIYTESGEKRIPIIIREAESNGIEVKSVNLRKPTLEDVFLHYTGKTIREHEASSPDRLRQHIRIRHRKTW